MPCRFSLIDSALVTVPCFLSWGSNDRLGVWLRIFWHKVTISWARVLVESGTSAE
ncbi:hypothetical protein J6590_099176, partial [Homalodisca vitripennis]